MAIVEWGEDFYDEAMEKRLNIDEDDILDAFIKLNTLEGDFKRKVRVGETDMYYDATGRMSRRVGKVEIDAICKEDSTVRVIEVEKQLTYTAIGQALAYAHLYEKQNPSTIVIPTIVCFFADEDLLEVCKKHNIDVHFCEYGHVPTW